MRNYGVVTGCDYRHEWMLEWWWNNYSKHNHWPVMFADFGMRSKAIKFAASHGDLISLRGAHPSKRNWFKKPAAMLACSFTKTVWIDLDCQIRGNISPLFQYAEGGRIGVTLDPYNKWVESARCVASGVVVAEYGNRIIQEWARRCQSTKLRGDQEVLNEIIRGQDMMIMPPEYQWLRLDGFNPGALIMHWTGSQGKRLIRGQIGQDSISGSTGGVARGRIITTTAAQRKLSKPKRRAGSPVSISIIDRSPSTSSAAIAQRRLDETKKLVSSDAPILADDAPVADKPSNISVWSKTAAVVAAQRRLEQARNKVIRRKRKE